MAANLISHPRYGRGVIRQSRHRGFELYVEFQDGLARWVRLDEVQEITGLPSSVPSLPTLPPDEAFKSRRMVEAFRLGIVPYDSIEEFTFGREKEIEQLLSWLHSSQESTLLIVGEYGTGKTHLLNYAYWRALDEGFAVASVEMDPNEVPFHKPKRIYSHLVQAFRYRPMKGKQIQDFRDFLKEALAKGAFKNHIYFRCLIGKTSDETLWDWIEARESVARPWNPYNWGYSYLPNLYDYSTAANIYCYLLSALSWAAKEVLGLKGLLLLFDEAETIGMPLGYQLVKGYNFLKAIISTAKGETALLKPPNQTELNYCKYAEAVPFLYKQPSVLKLLFAFTPVVESDLPRIDLPPLPDDALKEVFEHICLLYDGAYNFLEGDLTIDTIFHRVTKHGGRTRMFVKGSVEALDLIRLNPGKMLDEVLR